MCDTCTWQVPKKGGGRLQAPCAPELVCGTDCSTCSSGWCPAHSAPAMQANMPKRFTVTWPRSHQTKHARIKYLTQNKYKTAATHQERGSKIMLTDQTTLHKIDQHTGERWVTSSRPLTLPSPCDRWNHSNMWFDHPPSIFASLPHCCCGCTPPLHHCTSLYAFGSTKVRLVPSRSTSATHT